MAKRLAFDVSEDAYQRMEKLKKKMEMETDADLIKNALRVYEFFVDKLKDSWKISIEKEGEDTITIKDL